MAVGAWAALVVALQRVRPPLQHRRNAAAAAARTGHEQPAGLRLQRHRRAARLTKVADEVAFLKGLKTDPNQIFVAAITGPATPYSIEMIQQGMDPEMHPNIVHSCTQNSGEYADPSVRIQQWVEAFGNHGLAQTICADLVRAVAAADRHRARQAAGPAVHRQQPGRHRPRAPGIQPAVPGHRSLRRQRKDLRHRAAGLLREREHRALLVARRRRQQVPGQLPDPQREPWHRSAAERPADRRSPAPSASPAS